MKLPTKAISEIKQIFTNLCITYCAEVCLKRAFNLHLHMRIYNFPSWQDLEQYYNNNLRRYPSFTALKICSVKQYDLVVAPNDADIYDQSYASSIKENQTTQQLHFAGVCTDFLSTNTTEKKMKSIEVDYLCSSRSN